MKSETDAQPAQARAIEAFRALHKSGCFVIPNPWDAGSAAILQHLGFEALASTSAGVSFTRGRPDSLDSLSLEEVLAHFRELARATTLPVNADFQNGYADDPERVAANVTRAIATGIAGLSIEDATGRPEAPLYEARLAIERVRAARAAIDASGVPVLLTARCEAALLKQPNAMSTVIERLVAFAEAGADCLFAPGVRESHEIQAIVRAVAPKPINVLVSAPSPALSAAHLAELGVRRVSVGSALARVAWGAFIRAARSIKETGSFDALADAAPFAELDRVFTNRR